MTGTLLPNEITPRAGSDLESASVVESGDSGTQVGVLGGFETGALPTAATASECVEHALLFVASEGR